MTPTPAGTRPTKTPGAHAARPSSRRRLRESNWIGGSFGWIWLLIVMLPLYWLVITSFKTQANYFFTNPLKPPTEFTFENYQLVIESDFVRYFTNSVIVTAGAILPATLISFMAAYAIVRGAGNRFLRTVNGIFLMGLAIPLQAVVIPVYLIIIKMELYDTLQAIILPSIAFAIPLSVLVLSNFIRDVPKELFESMRMDGATEWGTMWRLAFPLTRPALVTVMIYNAVGIWNGFLLPLILTQSPEQATIPLALATFQTQFGVNVPAVAASVTLTTVPIVLLYAIGRRQLVSGLTAGFGK
jgi:raffinose/stachyose/melibiose transport system permease protein